MSPHDFYDQCPCPTTTRGPTTWTSPTRQNYDIASTVACSKRHRQKGCIEMSYARSRGPFLLWFTCGFEHIDHAINDDDMAIGISAGAGRYRALCGATVNVASMISPPGRRCSSCEAVVLQSERNSSPH